MKFDKNKCRNDLEKILNLALESPIEDHKDVIELLKMHLECFLQQLDSKSEQSRALLDKTFQQLTKINEFYRVVLN